MFPPLFSIYTCWRNRCSLRRLCALPVQLCCLPIRLYQRCISPLLPPHCRFYPSCSSYSIQALERYGLLRGSALALWRLLRCHPWSQGGYEPIPAAKDPAKNSEYSERDSPE